MVVKPTSRATGQRQTGAGGGSNSNRGERLRNPETRPAAFPNAKALQAAGTRLAPGTAAAVIGAGKDGSCFGRVLEPVTRYSKDGRRLATELAVVLPATGELAWKRDSDDTPVKQGAPVAVPVAGRGSEEATHPIQAALVFPDGTYTTVPLAPQGTRIYGSGEIGVELEGVTYSAEIRVRVRKGSWYVFAHIFSGGRMEETGDELLEASTL